MTDTANAPERIWTADTTSTCSVGFNTPSLDYKNEYVLATHCDELVAAAYVAASEKSWAIAVEMELHAAIGSTTKAKAEAIEGAILSGTPDNARAALTSYGERMRAEGAEAADEEAFARGANWAQEKARVEGRLVIVDSPELATLRADLPEARAKIARLTEAANALVDFHNAPLECKRPEMFQRLISRLAAALQENADE